MFIENINDTMMWRRDIQPSFEENKTVDWASKNDLEAIIKDCNEIFYKKLADLKPRKKKIRKIGFGFKIVKKSKKPIYSDSNDTFLVTKNMGVA